MSNTNSSVPEQPLTEIQCSNHLNIVRFAHRFTVVNFQERDGDYTIYSEPFSPPGRTDTVFVLQVQLKSSVRKQNANVILKLIKSKTAEFKVESAISLLTENDHKWYNPDKNEKHVNHFNSEKSRVILLSIDKTILREALKPQQICSKFQFMPIDKLIIYTELTCYLDNKITKMQYQTTSSQRLSANLGRLGNSDVKLLICYQKELKEFAVHKAILSAQSRVFADMFDLDSLGKAKSAVSLGDEDAEVFEELLSFMYSGKVSLNLKPIAAKLLALAEKYQVDTLKAICKDCLATFADEDTLVY